MLPRFPSIFDVAPTGAISREEARRNYYFRNGDPEHVFEAGQEAIPEWRDYGEEDVLLERVQQNLKPVASIVHPIERMKGISLEDVHEAWNMDFSIGINEWGVSILTITAQAGASLHDLLMQRDPEERELVAHLIRDKQSKRLLKTRQVRRYLVPGGFDMSSGLFPVNWLESALLYGYPLDRAGEEVDLDWSFW